MAGEDLRMSKILTRDAFQNAVVANGAIGGSTNAVVHLLALAGRLGVDFKLQDWDDWGRDVPTVVNLMPSGKYLMEDFYYAGGLPVVLKDLDDRINRQALTVNGKTLGENIANAECHDRDVIRAQDNPLQEQGGIAVLKGNLAPDGAVLKPSAATKKLMSHRGRAIVFEDIDDFYARIDSADLDINADDIMVLKNCGPIGYQGFPETGNMPLPAKILAQGVTDMVRISDARMSGTAYGTVVLHTAPEAAAGGPLALVRSGDTIELNVAERKLHLEVSATELKERRKRWKPPQAEYSRGYYKLYRDHVMQADTGADFDFLVGSSGAKVGKESH